MFTEDEKEVFDISITASLISTFPGKRMITPTLLRSLHARHLFGSLACVFFWQISWFCLHDDLQKLMQKTGVAQMRFLYGLFI